MPGVSKCFRDWKVPSGDQSDNFRPHVLRYKLFLKYNPFYSVLHSNSRANKDLDLILNKIKEVKKTKIGKRKNYKKLVNPQFCVSHTKLRYIACVTVRLEMFYVSSEKSL